MQASDTIVHTIGKFLYMTTELDILDEMRRQLGHLLVHDAQWFTQRLNHDIPNANWFFFYSGFYEEKSWHVEYFMTSACNQKLKGHSVIICGHPPQRSTVVGYYSVIKTWHFLLEVGLIPKPLVSYNVANSQVVCCRW